MNDAQLLELVAETDLYRPDSPLPESAWGRTAALREIERRIGVDMRNTTLKDTIETAPPGVERGWRRRWSGGVVAVAAFVVVLAVVGAVLAALNLTGGSDVATQPDEPQFGVESALATADRFFAATGAGDVGTAFALLAPEFQAVVGGDFERVYGYIGAAGVTFSEPECSASGSEVEVAIECTYEQLPYLNAAVGAPSIVMTATMTVTADGIASLNETSDVGPDVVLTPFTRWMMATHPEAADALGVFMQWDTAEAAEASGATVVEYADEYAAFLAANGCTYDAPCEP